MSIEIELKKQLIETSRHLGDMLDGSLVLLKDKTNQMRFSFAAHGLRELLRELFDYYAPDTEIKKSQWFIPDNTSKTGVTRKHRTIFSVYGYVNPSALPKSLSQEVEKISTKISKQVEHLSKYSHVTSSVLSKPDNEGLELLNSTLVLFKDLLFSVTKGKDTLIEELQIVLTQKLDDIFFNEVFDDLDILSTHTRPTGVWDIEVTISDIDEDAIYFDGSGTVSCDLQYGSDGDCSRGDGMEWENSFPFSFKGTADVMDLKPTVPHQTISIDTDDDL